MAESPPAVPPLDGSGLRVAVAVAEFNPDVSDGLLDGAMAVLESAGVEHVPIVRVPGCFELPLAAQRLAAAGYDAVVALGAVVEGETDHYEHIATQCSAGLMRVSLDTGVPVGFGVLTVRERDHAVVRSRGPDNKGAEAAHAALSLALTLDAVG